MKIVFFTTSLTFIFNLLVYLKMSHLAWLPGYISTWFFDNGLVYAKDFTQPHFFLPHLILYPFLKVTDWHLETDPAIAFVLVNLTVFLIFFFGQKIMKPIYLSLSIFFFSIFAWYASTWVQFSGELVSGLLILILSFSLFNFEGNSKKVQRSFLLGILFSLTQFSGQIVSLILVFLFLFYLKIIFKTKKYFHHLFLFFLGTTILILPLFIYLWRKQALGDFLFWNFTYYFTYAKLAKIAKGPLPWFEIMAVFSPSLVLFLSTISRKAGKNEALNLKFFLISIAALPFIILSIFHPHHYLIILPILSINLGLSLQKLKSLSLIPILLLLIFIISNLIPWYSDKLASPRYTNLASLERDPDQKKAAGWISSNSQLKEKILVTGDPLFYVRVRRLPANNRYTALPWHYLPLSNTEKIINADLPSFWIIDRDYLEKRLRIGWETPEIANYIEGVLEKCFEKAFLSGYWEVWKNTCSR